jgi:cytochrome P450
MMAAPARVPPGPRGAPLLGVVAAFASDPLGLLLGSARTYGPVVRLPLARVDGYLVSQPSGIKRVLQDASDNYGRQTRSFLALRETLGDSLLTTDGDYWRRQRRVAQPAFHKARLVGFGAAMAAAAAQMVERWRPRAARGETLEVVPELLALTLDILGRTLFAQDLGAAAARVEPALAAVLRHTMTTISAVVTAPRWLPTARNRRFRAALAALDEVVMGTIRRRRAGDGGDGGADLVSLLMAARDAETGEGMTDRQLRDEVMTLMLAGHETTAMALSWTFALLSRHPATRRALEEELARELGGRAPTVEDLPRLRLTRMVLDESMRLYPPAWGVNRSVIAADVIDGFQIPAGAVVFVSPWVTHRDPDLWENPEGFDPQRFASEPDARPRYAYFPFGGGPHLCIGAGFALMEAQIVLATVAQAVRLDLVPGASLVPEPLITLRPRGPMPMTARPR